MKSTDSIYDLTPVVKNEIQEKIQRDNEAAIARILMAKNYLKLRNDVAEFTAIIENQYLKTTDSTQQILHAIVNSDKFIELKNQSK
jgi:hypothetical protein